MPPKVKVTKEEIVKTAVELIRKDGEQAINARGLALALNCSTQPIFSNFATIEELQAEIRAYVYNSYLAYIEKEVGSGKYPSYKAFGMAYIRFAKEEKQLFKLLFMRDRTGEDLSPSQDFEKSVEIIMQKNGVSKETASLIHLEMWACVHGIATMIVTSFLEIEWEIISTMLTDVYQGVRARYVEGGEK